MNIRHSHRATPAPRMVGWPLSVLLCASIALGGEARALATSAPASAPATATAAAPQKISAAGRALKKSPYSRMKMSEKARQVYPAEWGVDQLKVSSTNSGNLIRFSYRIVEPKLAKALGDHALTPQLYAPRSHAMLQVPNMEKIGMLRQSGGNEANKDYWMVFSNKGNLVRPGERVNVIIGNFHADGLLVE